MAVVRLNEERVQVGIVASDGGDRFCSCHAFRHSIVNSFIEGGRNGAGTYGSAHDGALCEGMGSGSNDVGQADVADGGKSQFGGPISQIMVIETHVAGGQFDMRYLTGFDKFVQPPRREVKQLADVEFSE